VFFFFFPFEAFFRAFKALVAIPSESSAKGSEHRLARAGELHSGGGKLHQLLLLHCQQGSTINEQKAAP
jgi:hypothetical protein